MFVIRDKQTGLYLKRKNRSWHSEWFHAKYDGARDWFEGLFTAKTIDKAKMYSSKTVAEKFVVTTYNRPKEAVSQLKERLEVVHISLCPTGEACDEEETDVASA